MPGGDGVRRSARRWGASREQAAAIVHCFAHAGGNFIDTANHYAGAESERIVGELIAPERAPRDRRQPPAARNQIHTLGRAGRQAAACAQLSGLPDTLIVTAEHDALRDEAETFARRLQQGGVNVSCAASRV